MVRRKILPGLPIVNGLVLLLALRSCTAHYIISIEVKGTETMVYMLLSAKVSIECPGFS